MAVTDEQILERLRALLKESDLQTTTEKMLRKKLEEEFKMDLMDKKPIIRKEVDRYLAEDGESGGSEEDAQQAPPKKRTNQLGSLLSEPMQKFLGVETLPRTQVVKKIWEYIKEKNLQDPKDKRKILLDDKLRTLFTSPLTMFSMGTQLNKHCFTNDAADGPRPRASKPVAADKRPAPPSDDRKGKAKKAKGEEGGSTKANPLAVPMTLSADLASWVGQATMSRLEVNSFFWKYVKEHKLQDESDKRIVKCDAVLKKLTGQDSFPGISVTKFLTPHFMK